jgi:hypothetical protein
LLLLLGVLQSCLEFQLTQVFEYSTIIKHFMVTNRPIMSGHFPPSNVINQSNLPHSHPQQSKEAPSPLPANFIQPHGPLFTASFPMI